MSVDPNNDVTISGEHGSITIEGNFDSEISDLSALVGVIDVDDGIV